MRKLLLLLSLVLLSKNYFSQDWIEKASKPNANLYEIQKDFYEYFKDKDLSVKSTGYKAFKRWEYFVAPRVYPTGDISVLNQAAKNYSDFLVKNPNAVFNANKPSGSNSVMSASWTAVGPFGAPTGLVGGLPRKAGRDNFVTFHPSNSSTIYAGSAGGGLWESLNGGTSWTPKTDNLPVSAVSDLLVDPSNPNIMYLATGGGDDMLSGSPVGSDGLYKSTDAGSTWTLSSLVFSISQLKVIHKLAFDPTNSQIIFAATSVGVYRSINAGATWSVVLNSNIWDIKFNPGNASIVYVSGTSFFRSTNGGSSFTQVSTGIPVSGSNRMEIAVTPTNPSNVYVVASRSSDSQLLGVYRSTNDGASFVTASTSPNIIGNACNGSYTGTGQGWYDLAIAASPTNPNEIVVGGVNVWRSLNDGATWTNIGCWVGTGSPPFIHADIHELEYSPSGTLYSTNDGGIYSYTGSAWTDLTAQRNIAQIYKIGLSGLTANKWITGHQDNGTNIKNGASYVASLAGDGMDCFIDRTNDNVMFGEQYNGNIYRSTNGGASWAGISTGITGTGAWVTPWKQDPVNASTIYCGRNQMFISSNLGTNWTQMGTTGGSGSITEFAVAPSNNQVMYVLYPGSIRKTTDGGTSWTNVTQNVPGNTSFITISPTDPNKAWVTVSGFALTGKVFQTVDGGATWMNITSNLPNLPANCSVYEPGSNDRIYIGMDVGIYYKDNSTANWTLYNTGLPNVSVMDMEMSPAAPGKIFAATYGRGVYQGDVIPVTAAPVPNFSYYGSLCVGLDKALVDNSTNTPTSWSWSITPSAGVVFNSPTVQSPTLNFSTPGTYTVSLISGNSFGAGPVVTKTITAYSFPSLTLSINSATVCDQDTVKVTASGASSYTWSNNGGNGPTASYVPTIDWTYSVTASNGGCKSTATFSVTNITCVGIIEIEANHASFNIYPNPAIDNVILRMNSPKNVDVNVELYDALGKLSLKQTARFTKDKPEFKFNIASLANGIYSLKLVSKAGSSQTLKIVKE
ncbi:MAG: hypothetical protein JWO32_1643 [Bacteroidetes bacterium]|nr:hypothetical protein [Bacteroidota bacterium]